MDPEHTNLQPDLDNYLGARRALVDAITRQLRAGAPAMGIWRSVAPAFSRDQVKEYAAALSAHDRARKALTDAGLQPWVGVHLTGIDAPRQTLLALAADPAETPDVAGLPGRVREALRDYHLTLAATSGEHEAAAVDTMLLDSEPVRLVRARPLT
ncbi:hypothetical protein [Nocardiopsis synnemataformans]|uniref:hypothetical protein n=1 Tax=Nocardiopsis synnemataformans TaxID=61305 RepID=UPI003EB97EA4